MRRLQNDQLPFSPEEHALISVKRREMQALLRFMSRTYVYLVCHGRIKEAAELLHTYRGLGELEFGTLLDQLRQPGDSSL